MTFSMIKLNIMTLSTMTIRITIAKCETQPNDT
jgi:hypothetical protein